MRDDQFFGPSKFHPHGSEPTPPPNNLEVELVGGPQDGRTVVTGDPLRQFLIAAEPLPGRPDWNHEWEYFVEYDEEFECFRGVTDNVPRHIVDAANAWHRWAARMDDEVAPIYEHRGDLRHYDFLGNLTRRHLREGGQSDDGFDPRSLGSY